MIRDCTGCLFLFKAMQDNDELEYCRGAPPTAIWLPVGEDKFSPRACYPLRPRVRCGMFKRRWPWTRDK